MGKGGKTSRLMMDQKTMHTPTSHHEQPVLIVADSFSK
jgi:hypothetical protein